MYPGVSSASSHMDNGTDLRVQNGIPVVKNENDQNIMQEYYKKWQHASQYGMGIGAQAGAANMQYPMPSLYGLNEAGDNFNKASNPSAASSTDDSKPLSIESATSPTGTHRSSSSTPSPEAGSTPSTTAARPTRRSRPVSRIPEDKKDEGYWERRKKNNESAKRSRESRRQKEDEVQKRLAQLEAEYLKWSARRAYLMQENAMMRSLLIQHNIELPQIIVNEQAPLNAGRYSLKNPHIFDDILHDISLHQQQLHHQQQLQPHQQPPI